MKLSQTILLILALTLSLSASAQDIIPQKPLAALADSLSPEFPDSMSSEVPDSLPWPQNLQARLDTIVEKAKILRTSQMGLMVYDLTADSLLYAHDALQTLRPASTMKLITAITALDRLGTDYQYKTRLGYRGEIIDSLGVLVGDVYVLGTMDPMLSRDDLRFLADTLKALGIDTIRGNLYADRSFKDSLLYGEGWCWDDKNPMLSPLVYKRKDNLMEIFRDVLEEDSIFVTGDIKVGLAVHDTSTPEANAKEKREAPPATSLHHIADITRPITHVLKPMMKQSNNLYAESMYYQIAATQGKPATARKARAVEEALLNRIGESDRIHRFADGSGLSLYNYLSADIEVAFLRYAYRHTKNIYEPLYDSLPIAGVDGTLKDRLKDTSAYNNVHGKTGTLTGISSLAGYCTAANGHLIAFAIINQNVMKSVYAKRLQDKICVAMTK